MTHSSGQHLGPDRSAPRANVQLTFDRQLLRELVEEVLTETIGVLDWPAGRVALDEAEAAHACGVGRHVLRDMRLAGKITTHKLGRKFVYTRADLQTALRSNREAPRREDRNV